MEGIDSLLDETIQHAEELKSLIKRDAPTSERTRVAADYIDSLEEAEKNLHYLVTLAEYYVKGESYKILEFTHPVEKSTHYE